MITVKVKSSHLSAGPNAENSKIYRRGDVFNCSEEECKRFGNSVEKIRVVEAPQPVVQGTAKK